MCIQMGFFSTRPCHGTDFLLFQVVHVTVSELSDSP